MRILTDFGSYVRVVFLEGYQLIFTIFQVLGIILFFSPGLASSLGEYTVLVRTIGSFIFLISFLLANFLVYRRLNDVLSYRADMRFDVEQKDFSPAHGGGDSPFPEVQQSPQGFNEEGLPDWASLWARIRISNIGHEEGRWAAELDVAKTKLPTLFDRDKIAIRFPQATSDVPRRKPSGGDFYIYCLLTERNPNKFAQALKALVTTNASYRFVIRYWTVRIDGESRPRQLHIEGDFQGFYDKVFKHWSDSVFQDLSDIARITQ